MGFTQLSQTGSPCAHRDIQTGFIVLAMASAGARSGCSDPKKITPKNTRYYHGILVVRWIPALGMMMGLGCVGGYILIVQARSCISLVAGHTRQAEEECLHHTRSRQRGPGAAACIADCICCQPNQSPKATYPSTLAPTMFSDRCYHVH